MSSTSPRSALGLGGRSALALSRALRRRRPGKAAGLPGGLGNAASASVGGRRADVERGLAVARLAARRRCPSGSRSRVRAPGGGGIPCPRQQKPFLKFPGPGGRCNSQSCLRVGSGAAWAWRRPWPAMARGPELGCWATKPSCSPCPCQTPRAVV